MLELGPVGLGCHQAGRVGSMHALQLAAHRKHYTSELGGCAKVEVAVLGSPSLTVLMVSVDIKKAL